MHGLLKAHFSSIEDHLVEAEELVQGIAQREYDVDSRRLFVVVAPNFPEGHFTIARIASNQADENAQNVEHLSAVSSQATCKARNILSLQHHQNSTKESLQDFGKAQHFETRHDDDTE